MQGNEFWRAWRPGVLTGGQITSLFDAKILVGSGKDIGYSSLDLHIAGEGYLLKGSLKLKRGEQLQSLLKTQDYKSKHLDLSAPQLLRAGHTYVLQVAEEIRNCPKELRLYGVATGKSSIGRIDVLTRLIADGSGHYDELPSPVSNGATQLYVEVTPITFPIKVGQGDSLNQLRLFRGNPDLCLLRKEEIELFPDMIVGTEPDGSSLTLDLSPVDHPKGRVSAYTTTKKQFPDDLAIEIGSENKLSPEQYWSPIAAQCDSLLIKRDYFYILRSKERFRLPEDIAVYCKAITENLGEIRIHYAGFVHPGFGLDRLEGTPLIFEVRGHTVDAFLRDGELMANIEFYRTSEDAKPKKQSYGDQELKLSNYFKPW